MTARRRLIVSFLWLLCVQLCIPFQGLCAEDTDIVPGYGLNQVHVGMTEQQLLEVMPVPSETLNTQDLARRMADAGYNPEQHMMFALGFDHVHTWNPDPVLPVFTAYIRDGRLVLVSFSTFVFSGDIGSYAIDRGVRFHDSRSRVEEHFGSPDSCFDTPRYEMCRYAGRGLVAIYKNGSLVTIEVFQAVK